MQSELPFGHVDQRNYGELFKRIYYHLYSNSQAVRAERILEDLSKLLLTKLVEDKHVADLDFDSYLGGHGTANSTILPILAQYFPGLIGKDDLFSIGDSAVRIVLSELRSVDLGSSPAHVLGDAFQSLLGPRVRGEKGQFFTPRNLVRAMVRITGIRPGEKIVDPACGTGGFLSESFAEWQETDAGGLAPVLIGMEKDADLWRLCSSLLELFTNGSAQVLNQDSLDLKQVASLPEKQNPFGADVVLTNPPFGAKIGITDPGRLRQFDLGHEWDFSKSSLGWEKTSDVRRSQDPQILFLELCVRLLKPGGRMAIVLPEGVFGNRSSGYVWDYLRSEGKVLALLDCPRTTFQPSTDTKTNVLFFRRKQDESQTVEAGPPWIGVAMACGHDRRGRAYNSAGDPYPDDFLRLASAFAVEVTRVRVWSQPPRVDPYYLVPRYYDATTKGELDSFLAKFNGRVVTLGTLIEKGWVSVSKGHEVGSEVYGSGDIPFVRTSDIVNFEVNSDPTVGLSEEVYEQYAPLQNLAAGDILLVVDGRYRIGQAAMLSPESSRCVVQSHLRIVKVGPEAPLDAHELLLLLSSREVKHQVRNLVFVQSTLGSLGKRLLELKLPVPEKSEEWLAQVAAFRDALQQRSVSLERLRTMTAGEIEL